jgi:hypothetical protein
VADPVYAECCRCRHKHWSSDRVPGTRNKNGSTPQVCPRCRAKSYYPINTPDTGMADNGEVLS